MAQFLTRMNSQVSLCLYINEDDILVGEIVNVSADESIITDGKVDIYKLQPISFDPFSMSYYGVGEKVGHAYKDGMKLK